MVFFPVRYRVALATALVLPRHEKACCLDACYSCFFTPHQGHGEVHTAFFFFFLFEETSIPYFSSFHCVVVLSSLLLF